MAAAVDKVTLLLKLKGFQAIKGLDSDFKKFQSTTKLTKVNLDKFIKTITKVHGNTKLSKQAFEGQISALTRLKNQVGIGTVAYKKLGVELDKVKAKMKAATAAAVPQGNMFQRLNTRLKSTKIGVGARAGLGALAGSAASGLGSTGQLAFAGGAVGGPIGAAVGAGIGATVDTVKAAGAAARYAAQIGRLEIALKGVTKTQGEFVKAQGIIASVSDELNVPIGAATKQFTTLSASVIGAGGSVDDAEEVFRGVSEAIKATGGDSEDVQSAIRAMSQIFGKGKVSAEELQGQLGERLPGAVVKFADATGRTLPQLQKDLRDGTVGLNDVMKFVAKLSEDHRNAAIEMANSSMDAGQRLQVAMQKLQLNIGRIMQPIGAAIQKTMTLIVNAINGAIEAFKRFFGIGDENQLRKLENNLRKAVEATNKALSRGNNRDIKNAQKNQKAARQNLLTFVTGYGGDEGGDSNFQDPTIDKDTSPLKSFAKTAFDLAKQTEEAFVNAFKGMEDALVKFVMTGKLNFRDLANSIIADLTRMLVRYAIVQPLFKAIFPNIKIGSANGNVFSNGEVVPSAKGNVFAKNKIVPYAYGGIVNKPTLFPMANGMGLMGEAGPEAIMPLKRGANGKLGVQSSGGVGNIVVNVDASGTSVVGDEQRGKELGRLISVAVQSEILDQKRPGGLLA